MGNLRYGSDYGALSNLFIFSPWTCQANHFDGMNFVRADGHAKWYNIHPGTTGYGGSGDCPEGRGTYDEVGIGTSVSYIPPGSPGRWWTEPGA